jgi:hypothetical protein
VNQAFNLADKVAMNPAPAAWLGATSTIQLEQQLRAILA